jgi:hypothetical protein
MPTAIPTMAPVLRPETVDAEDDEGRTIVDETGAFDGLSVAPVYDCAEGDGVGGTRVAVGLLVGVRSEATGVSTATLTPGNAFCKLWVISAVAVELCSVDVILDAVTPCEGLVNDTVYTTVTPDANKNRRSRKRRRVGVTLMMLSTVFEGNTAFSALVNALLNCSESSVIPVIVCDGMEHTHMQVDEWVKWRKCCDQTS